jgi:hypothetical protein
LHDQNRDFAVIAEYTTPERSEGVGVDPTGTYVAYGVLGTGVQSPEQLLPSTLYVVRLGDAEVVATFEAAYASNYNRASFTTDGGAVAMVFGLCRPEVWTLGVGRLDGSRTTLLEGGSMAAKFSPDGKWLGITRGTELWAVPSDGSAPARRLAKEVHGPAGFEWSPDSRWISMAPYFGGFGQCP